MIYAIISIVLVVCGLSVENVGILAVAALFALASNVEIKINIGRNNHD